MSASLAVLVIRSRQPFFRSRPGLTLQAMTFAIVAVAAALPVSPLADLLAFVTLPTRFLVLLAAVVALYLLAAEIVKAFFYRRERERRP